MNDTSTAGGFIPPLSPPASVTSQTRKILPETRRTLLKHGGSKEARVFEYLDRAIDSIDGKVERKYEAIGGNRSTSSAVGYRKLDEMVKDIDDVVNVIWVSGTPSIQIPFLLSVAGRFIDYLSKFDFSPRNALKLLKKLDIVFASLLSGTDYESNLPLPNVNSRTVNVTEKVRLRSIVESSRIAVVNAYRKAAGGSTINQRFVNGETEDEGTATETETEGGDAISRFFAEEEDDEDWELEIGRVYERTLDLLGGLDPGPISMYSDTAPHPFAYS